MTASPILFVNADPEVAGRWRSVLEKALIEARIRNPKLRIAIKGHKDAEFGIISDIMEVLQKTNNTRFNLVTNFEDDTKPEDEGTSSRSVNDDLARR